MKKIHSMPSSYFIYFVSLIAAVTGLLFGFDAGAISGAILFIREDFGINGTLAGITVSAVLFGAALGSIASGKLADKFGRCKILLAMSLIFLSGIVLSVLSRHVSMLIVARIILGIAIGMGSFISPLYLAEIAPKEMRGMLISLFQLAITIGIVLGYAIDLIFVHTHNWRLMLGCGAFPALLLFFGALALPESPRWMMLQGKTAQAQATLKLIHNSDSVDDEISAIKAAIIQEKGHWRLLFDKSLRPIFYISLGLSFFQQGTGINTIIYYSPTILEIAGFDKETSAPLATFGIGLINVLFTLIALPLIDRWGRKPLLLFGLTGMFVSLTTLGIVFYFPHLRSISWLPVLCMITYVISFAMSLGPIMYVVIAEIFPLNIRGLGVSLSICATWIFNALVVATFLLLLDHLGVGQTFWLYALLCLLGILFVHRIVPETKNISLEQIEINLRQKFL